MELVSLRVGDIHADRPRSKWPIVHERSIAVQVVGGDRFQREVRPLFEEEAFPDDVLNDRRVPMSLSHGIQGRPQQSFVPAPRVFQKHGARLSA
ncbi:MAG TPA: hypothetical protein VEQ41_03145 [Solirubrobacterales bacterium]|nr:hypothetical protein [Solirubrobacterales bacterium]